MVAHTALDSSLGRGVYAIAEAARLTDVKPATVRAWFRGRRRDGGPVGRGPLLDGDYGSPNVISFLDLIEVLVAGHLREAGVSLGTVRRAHGAIARHLRTGHPFGRRELCTDGGRIFLRTAADADAGGAELLEVIGRQHFFERVMRPYLTRVDYDPATGLARSWAVADGVVIDPAVSLGKPVVVGTGIPASVLAAAYRANGDDADAVGAWYGVSPDDVRRAARFAAA
jgi:uncharacterized protein (DUF433 family)